MICIARPKPAERERYFALLVQGPLTPILKAVNTVNAEPFAGVPPGEALFARADVKVRPNESWLVILTVKIRRGGFHPGNRPEFQLYPTSDVLSKLPLAEAEVDLAKKRELWES